MVVDAAGAVGRLITLSLEAAALRTTQEVAEGRCLKSFRTLPAEAAIQVVFFSGAPINLDVEAVLILGEWKSGGVVIGRTA